MALAQSAEWLAGLDYAEPSSVVGDDEVERAGFCAY